MGPSEHHTRRLRARLRTALAVGVVTAWGVAAVPALARAPVVGTSPSNGAHASDVRSVAVRFGEPVLTGLISVRKADGGVVRARLGGLTGDRKRLREVFAQRLRPGRYTVRWIVLAADGDRQRGSFRFSVR